MMGAEEADKVQDELATAMGALTRAQAILYPHYLNRPIRIDGSPILGEAEAVLQHVKRAMREVENATEDLDTDG